MDLYTNRKSQQDFIKDAFLQHAQNDMDIDIASAFFTEFGVVESLVKEGCHIRIIVRLGFPTSPIALEKLLQHPNIEARYFTNHSFHPKLYIFGNETIFVGSANLTGAALLTNQEIIISLNSNDIRFNKLKSLFQEYWKQAFVLDNKAIKSYRKIYSKYAKVSKMIEDMEDEVLDNLGDKGFSNINRGKAKIKDESADIENYRKAYQSSLFAFRRIEKEYKTFPRKVSEKLVPLRLEIDSFISFVRDKYAVGESWKQTPVGWTNRHKSYLRDLINDWLSSDYEYFEKVIVPIDYPLINKTLGSPETIEASCIDEIVESLCVLHSFKNRLRFNKGGLETLKNKFIKSNGVNQIKNTLIYLLYGNDDVVIRMANCIDNKNYKLKEFGPANVQELIGWVNKENLPVINGRTTKVLRYLGNDVHQLGYYNSAN